MKNKPDLQKVLARIDQLIDAVPSTAAFNELNVPSNLVFAYEEQHYSIDAPGISLLKQQSSVVNE